MSAQKVIVAGWWTVDPDRRDEAVESFKDLVLRARGTPGCLDLAITADPVDSTRINIFEFWQSERHLNSWRAVSRPPKRITRTLRLEVQKHVIQHSGPPFAKRQAKRRSSTRR